ncbi:MAG: DUF4160 domain-containing protein [Betaproteobacteria bacterium]|jgi:hypothetical protein
MPKIYEYLGIVLFFYSNEHEPIHIHGTYDGRESKAEIHFFGGRIQKILIRDRGPGLEPGKRRDFEEFVNAYAEEIADKWTDYFVKKKHISPQIITQRVKNVRTVG